MDKPKRFALPARVLGAVCALGLLFSLIVFAVAGVGMVSGVVLAASLTGLLVPAVVAAEKWGQVHSSCACIRWRLESMRSGGERLVDWASAKGKVIQRAANPLLSGTDEVSLTSPLI